ncbi:hypothetical protein CL634_10075 [bacterium]|nr:hypothetical protein [bacterium]
MITKTNIKEPTISVNDEKMSVYEVSRWFSLLEALDLITKKAQMLKVDLKKEHKWVKPIALQKYIDERINSVIVDVEKEHIDNKI